MTEQEAVRRLEAIYQQHCGDDEAIHSEEDQLMLKIIEEFGFDTFVSVYEDAEHQRWCA